MAINDKEPCPSFFSTSFVSVDESDATSADFQAPKKENRWCLIEISKEQLEALEAGKLFHIKAHSSRSAALCSENVTQALEFLENSNPMYLGSVAEVGKAAQPVQEGENKDPNSPPVAKQCTIFAQCRGHVILKPLSSDAQRVRDLLSPHSIDETGDGAGMSFSALQFQVAASPKELRAILEQGPYAEHDGVWRWLPAAFQREVTDVSLNLISLKNWQMASLDVEALLLEVQKHYGEDGARCVPSTSVLLNVLRGVTLDAATPASASDKPADGAAASTAEATPAEPQPTLEEGKLAMDPAKVKLFQATQLLRESPARLRERFDLPAPAARPKRPRLGTAAAGGGGGSALQIEDFAAAFSALTGTETSIEDLCKIVGERMYIDEMDGAVHPLDVTTLPQEPRERLKRLFELSSHWKPDRISPLLAPTVKGAKVDVWIMKYTKTVYWEIEKGKEVRMITKKFGLS